MRSWRGVLSGLVAVVLLLSSGRTAAHDIPNEVTVLAFVKPEGRQLTLLVRAPLKAMRDMDMPVTAEGNLDLSRMDTVLRDAAGLWIGDFVQVYENGNRLSQPEIVAARVALPSDRAFESFDLALTATMSERLPLDTQMSWNQGLLDVAFRYPIQSDRSDFAVNPGLTHLGLRVNISLRFLSPGGAERAYDVHGDDVVQLDPRWHQTAMHFVKEGFSHILDGTDYLLFILCFVLPFRRFRELAVLVTSFTVAHSVTLIASAYDMAPNGLWFPPLVETLIAVSIVYMAIENIVGAKIERRWLVTFAFGLVYGFGFSFALRQTLQFAGAHALTALLAFNVGLELGMLMVLALLIPALSLLFRYVVAERVGTILLSAFVAHTGWHWAINGGSRLVQFPWPAFDLVMLASAMRLLMVILIAGGLAWFIMTLTRSPKTGSAEHPAVEGR